MKISTIALLLPPSLTTTTTLALKVSSSDLTGNSFKDNILTFKDRIYVPYGPDRVNEVDPSVQPWNGYGFGMGATEHWAYDYKEQFIYSQSESGGYITVIDYSVLPGFVSTYSFGVPGASNVDIRDIVVCPEEGLLFVSVSDQEKIILYETVKRAKPAVPTIVKELDVGNTPDALK